MGKTEKGAVWLNEKLFSVYDYWQFWRNVDDRDVKKFLYFFTEIEYEKINTLWEKEENINNLKILLANQATSILHGKSAAKKAQKTAKETFEDKSLSLNLPEIKVKSEEVKKGISLIDLLSVNGVMSSKSEARRAILNNGLKINDKLVGDVKRTLKPDDFEEKILKISYGKKKHYKVKII